MSRHLTDPNHPDNPHNRLRGGTPTQASLRTGDVVGGTVEEDENPYDQPDLGGVPQPPRSVGARDVLPPRRVK